MGLSNNLSCEAWSFSFCLDPCGFFSVIGFEALFPHTGTLGCVACLTSRLFSQFICMQIVGLPGPPAAVSPARFSSRCLAACHLCLSCPSPPLLLVCEWFFFNSLVVGLPYSSIFWQFWLFFVFKFVVVLLLVVQVGKVYLPTTPSWLVVIFVASLSPCFTWMDKS